jgi:hypothetical protein
MHEFHFNTMRTYKTPIRNVGSQGTHMDTLATALAALSGSLRDQAPAAILATIDESLAALALSGRIDRALREGDLAPDFALRDATGAVVESRRLRSRGPLADSTFALPLPATCLVGRDAAIVGAWVDADYRRRAEPSAVLDRVRAIAGPGDRTRFFATGGSEPR